MKILLENQPNTKIVKTENDIPWGYIKQAETKHIVWFVRGAEIYAMGKDGVDLEHTT